MTAVDMKKITSAPKNYADWISCFDIMQNSLIDREEFIFLKNGTCGDIDNVIQYFEIRLVKTINFMIRKYIKNFRREFSLCVDFNDYECIHRHFISFANRINDCLFFTELNFLSRDFRNELLWSVMNETTKIWKSMLDSLYFKCIDGTPVFEEQMLMIKRIRLFSKGKCLIA